MGFEVTAKNEQKISVIVVNWNGVALLDDCLGPLSCQTYDNYEIIFVDNGSSDHSVRHVQKNFPHVKIVELDENRGFTGGNSAGLEVAEGEFIALVNNDARVELDWIERIVHPMVKDPTVGICASKLIVEGTLTIDSAGIGVTTAGVGFNRGYSEEKSTYYVSAEVFGACAAGALYRRKMLDEIGFLDEDFFLYSEDVDLSFRSQLSGWKCLYIPSAVVYHKLNATAGRLSDVHVYYHTRNLEFVWIKNMPLTLMLRFAHHKIIQEFGSFFYLCLRHGKWKPFFRAKRDALMIVRKMVRKRREIQRRRKVSKDYIKGMMTSILNKEWLMRKTIQFVHG